ncbi:hypothetical protein [Streptomyces spectabilis]|uniref:DUF11 domain-containing protein n=1 Tax=Streptomyces spectabilis TaxID=68270 RepID=A0A7W8AVF7_STRST|nr:hypothetical protein [Streptomyces spectabilis]MBB5105405.1 hypothetical protein [Streptomyces spectabilis]MCI3906598.1 hypothetical protein [Streptomyces spectabilis]
MIIDSRAERRRPRTQWRVLFVLASSVPAVMIGAAPAGPAVSDGASTNGLALRVTVNSHPEVGALRPGIRVGDPVVKTYRLINRGGADLYQVRVTDPGLPGVAIRCQGGGDRVRMLRGLSSTHCTARTAARAGVWTGQVVATGNIPYLRARSVARARSGYAGVGGGLALSEGVMVRDRQATVTYRVRNTGNRTVHAIRLGDPPLTGARIDCGGGQPVVPTLQPGRSAECRTVVRRAPGAYTSAGVAEGSDRVRTIGRSGGTVPPPRLTARALRRFEIPRPAVTPKPPKPPKPSEPRRPGGGPAGPPVPAPPPAGPPPAAGPLPAMGPVPPEALPVPLLPGEVGPPVPPPGVAAPGDGPGAAEAAGEADAPAEPPGGAVAGAAVAGADTGGAAVPPAARPRGDALGRFYRAGEGPTGLGLLTALFLVLIPAAVAAAVLGSRRG